MGDGRRVAGFDEEDLHSGDFLTLGGKFYKLDRTVISYDPKNLMT